MGDIRIKNRIKNRRKRLRAESEEQGIGSIFLNRINPNYCVIVAGNFCHKVITSTQCVRGSALAF